jgi:hypothetical protein
MFEPEFREVVPIMSVGGGPSIAGDVRVFRTVTAHIFARFSTKKSVYRWTAGRSCHGLILSCAF